MSEAGHHRSGRGGRVVLRGCRAGAAGVLGVSPPAEHHRGGRGRSSRGLAEQAVRLCGVPRRRRLAGGAAAIDRRACGRGGARDPGRSQPVPGPARGLRGPRDLHRPDPSGGLTSNGPTTGGAMVLVERHCYPSMARDITIPPSMAKSSADAQSSFHVATQLVEVTCRQIGSGAKSPLVPALRERHVASGRQNCSAARNARTAGKASSGPSMKGS